MCVGLVGVLKGTVVRARRRAGRAEGVVGLASVLPGDASEPEARSWTLVRRGVAGTCEVATVEGVLNGDEKSGLRFACLASCLRDNSSSG